MAAVGRPHISSLTALVTLVFFLGIGSQAEAQSVISLEQNISGTQGSNGVSYQYYDTTGGYRNMVRGVNAYGQPASGIGWVEPAVKIASIYQIQDAPFVEAHPSDTLDAVLVWQSSTAASVRIAGTLTDADLADGQPGGGNGVRFLIFKNTQLLFDVNLPNRGTTTFDVATDVSPGDRI
jgi:hypothetical protein